MTTRLPRRAASMPPRVPRHDMTVASCEYAVENLVPADQTAAAVTEPFLDPGTR